jgi:uncharacterized membrane protein
MTIGLVMGALVFAIAGLLFQRESLRLSAWHCTILAFLVLFPTILLGLMDWKHFYAGALPVPIKMKLILAIVLFVLLLVGILIGRRLDGKSIAVLIIYGLCVIDVIGMGYFGGELVYGAKGSSTQKEFRVGEQIFRTNCSACHPNGGNTLVPDKPITTSPKLVDFSTFLGLIRDPTPPMPPFPETKISDKQCMELYQYITNDLKK